uniref:Uncharacterized protein n=1 Tax=Chromera velia CCMP2878 TaxID=1169474 RepID=A0A0G4IE21_9ALVE|eukprot:Cvel_13583.t1-p1 / transcript=Cvel_13583.t1 / gene=Cvel_13583 / organism=Chromera_velia_CCMP2878 / gene_product=hypothetical protein / transcript_product=hypothetical protein / location=Cvel_scaffold934:2304-4808(-) / protein_length=467 / sequence_SO=supercontig / SO=protein_coding / is_pseudo=false
MKAHRATVGGRFRYRWKGWEDEKAKSLYRESESGWRTGEGRGPARHLLSASLWDHEGFRYGVIFGGVALVGALVALVLWLVLRNRKKKRKEGETQAKEKTKTAEVRQSADATAPEENRKSHDVGLVHHQERQSLVVTNQHHRMSIGEVALDEFHKQFVESKNDDQSPQANSPAQNKKGLKDSWVWPESRRPSITVVPENAEGGDRGAGAFASPESVALHERHRRQKEGQAEGEDIQEINGTKNGGVAKAAAVAAAEEEGEGDIEVGSQPCVDPSLTPTTAAAFLMETAARWVEIEDQTKNQHRDPAEADYDKTDPFNSQNSQSPNNSRSVPPNQSSQGNRSPRFQSSTLLPLPPNAQKSPPLSPTSKTVQGKQEKGTPERMREGDQGHGLPPFPSTPRSTGRSPSLVKVSGETPKERSIQVAEEVPSRPPPPVPDTTPVGLRPFGGGERKKKKKKRRRSSVISNEND